MNQRGDTIIEVLLAFAVFSLVSVSALVVMGQGTNAAQRALEITLVRQQIDAQAEALRAAQQAFTTADANIETEWEKFALSGSINDSQRFDDETRCPQNKTEVQRTFVMDPRTAQMVPSSSSWLDDINGPTAPPYAQMQTNPDLKSYGMWIERTFHAGTGNQPGSYDFTIRACWYGAGLDIPLQLQTSVRLYEPAV